MYYVVWRVNGSGNKEKETLVLKKYFYVFDVGFFSPSPLEKYFLYVGICSFHLIINNEKNIFRRIYRFVKDKLEQKLITYVT